MKLEWMDPPAIKHRVSETQQILDELQKNPGTWARIQQGMKYGSAQSRWVKLGCEAVSRANPTLPNRYDIYARWPAETKPTAPPAASKTFKAGGIVPPAKTTASKPVQPAPKPIQPAPKPIQHANSYPAPPEGATSSRPEKTFLDPDDPNDQYLARQRAQFESERAARIAKAGRKSDYAKAR